MLRERKNIIDQMHKALDIGLTIAAFVSAYFIKVYLLPEPFRGLLETPNYFIVLLLIVIIWPLSFNYVNLYSSFRNQSVHQLILKVVKSSLIRPHRIEFCHVPVKD